MGTPEDRRDVPFHWWGPRWELPEPLGLRDLIDNGTLSLDQAAHLAVLVAARKSLVIAAGPSHAGKTTLLTALTLLLPEGTRRIYVRGMYESFPFLDDPAAVPHQSALLVNEISPHLPVYLWGPGVGKALRAVAGGYQLLATAHALDIDGFIASLAGPPLRLPVTEIARIGAVAHLTPCAPGRFRLGDLWALRATGQAGLERHRIVSDTDVLEVVSECENGPSRGDLDRVREALTNHDPRYARPPRPRWPDL